MIKRPQRGFSLVEVIVASSLVGMVVVTALATLEQSLRSQRRAGALLDGPLLADSLLTEIMAMPYLDPETKTTTIGRDTGEANTSRLAFDDVDDYHNWTETTVQNKEGVALARYAGWSRSVQVQWAGQIDGNQWILWDTGFKRIRVRATSPTGVVTERWGYRWKTGTLEQAGATDKLAVTQLRASITVGSSTPVVTTTSLLNAVESPGN